MKLSLRFDEEPRGPSVGSGDFGLWHRDSLTLGALAAMRQSWDLKGHFRLKRTATFPAFPAHRPDLGVPLGRTRKALRPHFHWKPLSIEKLGFPCRSVDTSLKELT